MWKVDIVVQLGRCVLLIMLEMCNDPQIRVFQGSEGKGCVIVTLSFARRGIGTDVLVMTSSDMERQQPALS